MSGQFRIDTPDAELPRHARVVFSLDDDRQLRFIDQRMFGGLELASGGAVLPASVSHIVPDMFDSEFDEARTVERIRGSQSAIKRLLLNQRVVSGIGNIYADEALWQAGVHPETPANSLNVGQVKAVLDAAKNVMTTAIASGGTSFDALYVNINGDSGYFALQLNAYSRAGLPCSRCGTTMQRTPFMGRSSVFCPTCQRLQSAANS
jgi:formamidopyrimidine-DNA glycosylase